MSKAAKIVGDGAQRMKQEVESRGPTVWGNFFRAAFALSMFKRLVRVIEQGAAVLRKTNDPDSKKVDADLKKYHEGLERFSAILAKLLSPVLGAIGEMLNHAGNMLQDIIDAADAITKKGNTQENFDRIRRERREAQQRLKDEAAARATQEMHDRDRFKLFMAQVAKLNQLRSDLVTPLEKYLDIIRLLGEFVSVDSGAKIIANEREKLIKALGLEEEKDAYSKFAESVSNIQAIRRLGIIDEMRMSMMLGEQVEKLAASQEKLADAKPPEALIRGTAAAFSAINEFQRSRPEGAKKDAATIIAEGQKQAANQRAELIRLGKEAAKVKIVGD